VNAYKASLNGEFHRPGFQDVKLWYEIDVFLIAQFHRLKGPTTSLSSYGLIA
jgi:hypothetical protein